MENLGRYLPIYIIITCTILKQEILTFFTHNTIYII